MTTVSKDDIDCFPKPFNARDRGLVNKNGRFRKVVNQLTCFIVKLFL
jgi:hypothetical protein